MDGNIGKNENKREEGNNSERDDGHEMEDERELVVVGRDKWLARKVGVYAAEAYKRHLEEESEKDKENGELRKKLRSWKKFYEELEAEYFGSGGDLCYFCEVPIGPEKDGEWVYRCGVGEEHEMDCEVVWCGRCEFYLPHEDTTENPHPIKLEECVVY